MEISLTYFIKLRVSQASFALRHNILHYQQFQTDRYNGYLYIKNEYVRHSKSNKIQTAAERIYAFTWILHNHQYGSFCVCG